MNVIVLRNRDRNLLWELWTFTGVLSLAFMIHFILLGLNPTTVILWIVGMCISYYLTMCRMVGMTSSLFERLTDGRFMIMDLEEYRDSCAEGLVEGLVWSENQKLEQVQWVPEPRRNPYPALVACCVIGWMFAALLRFHPLLQDVMGSYLDTLWESFFLLLLISTINLVIFYFLMEKL